MHSQGVHKAGWCSSLKCFFIVHVCVALLWWVSSLLFWDQMYGTLQVLLYSTYYWFPVYIVPSLSTKPEVPLLHSHSLPFSSTLSVLKAGYFTSNALKYWFPLGSTVVKYQAWSTLVESPGTGAARHIFPGHTIMTNE
jgi:hypothetical protein